MAVLLWLFAGGEVIKEDFQRKGALKGGLLADGGGNDAFFYQSAGGRHLVEGDNAKLSGKAPELPPLDTPRKPLPQKRTGR